MRASIYSLHAMWRSETLFEAMKWWIKGGEEDNLKVSSALAGPIVLYIYLP